MPHCGLVLAGFPQKSLLISVGAHACSTTISLKGEGNRLPPSVFTSLSSQSANDDPFFSSSFLPQQGLQRTINIRRFKESNEDFALHIDDNLIIPLNDAVRLEGRELSFYLAHCYFYFSLLLFFSRSICFVFAKYASLFVLCVLRLL